MTLHLHDLVVNLDLSEEADVEWCRLLVSEMQPFGFMSGSCVLPILTDGGAVPKVTAQHEQEEQGKKDGGEARSAKSVCR